MKEQIKSIYTQIPYNPYVFKLFKMCSVLQKSKYSGKQS